MKNTGIILIAAAMVSFASCKNADTSTTTGASDSTAVLLKDKEVTPTEKKETNWDKVDFTSPIVKYKEITSKYVDVRGSDAYSIYGVGEEVLFSSGKADILPDAKACLGEVCSSIGQHYPSANIRVYGYTDSKGSSADNKALSMQRAVAVRNYLVSNCNIPADNVVAVAEGESRPVATNDNAQGRQENRRVQIVAMNK